MPRGSRQVFKFSVDGELIMEFPSYRAACRSLGLKHPDGIRKAVKSGKVYYGFIWKQGDFVHRRKTVAYCPFTNVYFYFRGVYDCARNFFLTNDVLEWRVSYAIRTNKFIDGFIFFYKNENDGYQNIFRRGQSLNYGTVKRPVFKLRKGTGEVLERYECARDAALGKRGFMGQQNIRTIQTAILDCCKGEQFSAYGNQWRFA